ncbi:MULTISPECIES: carboxy-S-adenosyl-L-methionine synthase CmoA [Helicobacter]|uniref:Carboxy-S-adenosyl-L-methionine synthase n=1 Tax=Helicobacter ibis TaxID=2962633 RepID=A0ABT4VDZ6_9HELI|nr:MULTISPECIES: carboxy-S-adenosyl-L-methionine synthase CmoA [Helicobacter]MDA3966489.1 carboxy-S-adenosyl-L-methionine synthase CmoA [Helicobacter sp. WB40]MDA3968895.1 carboxy-S-adenosyl-L-methionine synthase CmoA [Helicobacter ibis]
MDKVFSVEKDRQFEFDESVADVFDDMLSRSVPFYKEVLELSSSFALSFVKEGDRILDLGTSTASMLVEIARKSKYKLDLVGIDNSPYMIKHAKNKLLAYGINATLIEGDVLEYDFGSCNCIISNYTLQFIRPPQRLSLVKKISNSIKEGGVFICSEKTICEDKGLDYKFINYYLDYKKSHGYSEFEINKKREALENVLVPYSEEENKKMFLESGFRDVQILFKWVNFATFIAIK